MYDWIEFELAASSRFNVAARARTQEPEIKHDLGPPEKRLAGNSSHKRREFHIRA
jgi:hypothetical protein